MYERSNKLNSSPSLVVWISKERRNRCKHSALSLVFPSAFNSFPVNKNGEMVLATAQIIFTGPNQQEMQ